jgi:hypothetical protein
MKTAQTITIEQAAASLREGFGERVVNTWIQEFGYANLHVIEPGDPLVTAINERGPRIRRELSIHSKRLADRATMAPSRIVGRSSVIP